MNGRIALVTGAGRGIGRAVALELAAAGACVAATARTRRQLESVVAQIENAGGAALLIADDLFDPAAPERIVAQVREHWGPVEILVNNAGVGSSSSPRPIVEFDDDFWERTMTLNVTAPYRLTKAVLPEMIRAGWGRIINVASINAKVPAYHGCAYTASKHALAGLTKATARETAGSGVTANAVCPGITATLMNDKRLEYDAKISGKSIQELQSQATPLGRRLTAEEIAPLAVFLAGDGAAAISGQLINVCGGAVMG